MRPYNGFMFSSPVVFGHHMQHGVMYGRVKHGGVKLVVKERAARQFLQDVHCFGVQELINHCGVFKSSGCCLAEGFEELTVTRRNVNVHINMDKVF